MSSQGKEGTVLPVAELCTAWNASLAREEAKAWLQGGLLEAGGDGEGALLLQGLQTHHRWIPQALGAVQRLLLARTVVDGMLHRAVAVCRVAQAVASDASALSTVCAHGLEVCFVEHMVSSCKALCEVRHAFHGHPLPPLLQLVMQTAIQEPLLRWRRLVASMPPGPTALVLSAGESNIMRRRVAIVQHPEGPHPVWGHDVIQLYGPGVPSAQCDAEVPLRFTEHV